MANNEYTAISEAIMEHIGNKNSGRYPRGSGDRPWQHISKSTKRTISKQVKKNIKLHKKAMERYTKNADKEIKKEKDPYKIIEDRKAEAPDVKAKGSVIKDTHERLKYIYKNREYYTTQEIKAAVKEYEAEASLSSAIAKSTPPTRFKKMVRKIDEVGKSTSKVIDIARDGALTYNKAARIYNAFSANAIKNGKKKPWKILDIKFN